LKKVYSITENGKKELQRLSRDFPEMPEIRKPFSIQLLFGGDLSKTEAESLLDRYADEIEGTIAMLSDETPLADPTPYQAILSKLTTDNIRRFYESELLWVEKVRSEALPLLPDESDACRKKDYDVKMETIKVQKNGKDYVKVISGKINNEKDGLALVSACIENDTNRLLLPPEALSDAFYDLSTQLTGLVLQKLVNYRIRAAAVIESAKFRGKFKDFMIETNRGQMFRLFEDFKQAEDWLLKD
jgi:phage gp36-like protein